MKIGLSCILCCILSLFCFLFAPACKEEKSVNSGVLNYNAEVIVISEVDAFAPCNFYDFFHGNPHMEKFFQYAYKTTQRQSVFDVTIDGTPWTHLELITQELPTGTYKIVIETKENFCIVKINENGSREQVPYHKKMTITVSVSPTHEDKYSIE